MFQLRLWYYDRMKFVTDLDELLLIAHLDPVKNFSGYWRVSHQRNVVSQMSAYISFGLCTDVPDSYDQLELMSIKRESDIDGWPHLSENNSVLVPYSLFTTVKSKGHARQLLTALLNWAHQGGKIERFVTLSPDSKTVRSFHLHCGAQFLRNNGNGTVNYEYTLK